MNAPPFPIAPEPRSTNPAPVPEPNLNVLDAVVRDLEARMEAVEAELNIGDGAARKRQQERKS